MSNYHIVPTDLAVTAMRDNGYKNASYAIAELVDNSVQAGADLVEILCEDEEEVVRTRSRRRVKKLAVIDNGIGMGVELLRKALQFGNGSRLDDRSGIGRFGMGLPNSSISQARKLEVWTWQNGTQSAVYSYLDIDQIESGEQIDIPKPESKDLPTEWVNRSSLLRDTKTGTLVLWTNLDKCDWKTAKSIFRNSEFTIGRIYRHWLNNDKLKIRVADFLGRKSTAEQIDELIQPNDPLYVTVNQTLPPPWNMDSMFESYGQPIHEKVDIGGVAHRVVISFSIVKKSARAGYNQGNEAHGKHAGNNIGVSIVRAGRELELQKGWCIGYNPMERWWGVEVDFPPALDEIFGVTNNKQSARTLEELSHLSLAQIAEREGYDSSAAMEEQWREDHDPRLILIKVKKAIESNLSTIRSLIKQMNVNTKKGVTRHDPRHTPENKGTEVTRIRQDEGFKGTSDGGEQLPTGERIEALKETLTSSGIDSKSAEEQATEIVKSGRKYEFIAQKLDSTSEFFTVRPRGGAIVIGLNVDHPAYDHLVALLEDVPEDEDSEAMRLRLSKSFDALKLLIMAWARYEDELSDGRSKEQAQDARAGWGRMAREFLRDE